MALAQSLLGSALWIDSLVSTTSSGTKAQLRTLPIENYSCSLTRRSREEQRSEKNVSRTRSARALSVSWTSGAIDSQRSCCFSSRRVQCMATSYTVEMIYDGVTHLLQVPDDETILSVALEENLDVPHDCKLGVCMTCPAKLEKGIVDQSGGMLSDDVVEQGYALMCVAYPQSDCTIRVIPEEELLRLQLATAND